jgi:hypothetical protein
VPSGAGPPIRGCEPTPVEQARRLEWVAIVECTVPDIEYGEFMSLIKGLVKTAVLVKLVEVAQRELSKPENQQKIKDGIRKLQETARSRR